MIRTCLRYPGTPARQHLGTQSLTTREAVLPCILGSHIQAGPVWKHACLVCLVSLSGHGRGVQLTADFE